ncbi:uncharacterized protein N7459_004452 [Penicillium hispanicum]|uniref:uncharacterized protein n=1 Tax=Penicillium hispanicum TaxID=1080232 RepID=UPI0025424372|nr:uncharacterized protein N7459_004452 [Penicillium hispanicum]KAJ5584652.1 hypothetical protein N7459_004452 [Penicillium hispanicum]
MVSVATTGNSALTATPSINRSKMIATSSPVSILKTSKPVGTKRKMDEVDLSLSPSSSVADAFPEDTPPSKKRPRVTFDDKSIRTHEVPIKRDESADSSGKGLALVREEVRRAIHRHVSAADSEAYDQVKEVFNADPRKADSALYSYDVPTHTSLRHHLMALLSHIASLDRNCSSLVHAVLGSEWLGRDETYVKLYIRFLGNLAAAQGTYLGVIFKMLVGKLAGIPRGTGRLPGYPFVQPSEIYSRVHMALRYVMRLVPAASGTLSPILSSQFPFETDPAKSYVAYTRNLIHIISYAPELQSDILSVITEKLVKVDVQIQVDLEDFEDEIGENLLQDVSPDVDDELDDDDDDDASIMSDDSDEDQRVQEIKANIHKVDGMIDVLFEYYTTPFTEGSLDDKENTLDLLLSHFQTIILPTYRSRHSQFLLFHFSQSSPVLVDRFASACVELIFNKLQPGIMRQSAAAYLASFVARGAHISGEVIRDVFDLLLTHLNNLRVDYESSCRGPDLRRYGPFYSTAQALLYIFCFRWRDLTTAAIEGDSPEQVEELEPSQVTFPPRVKEFLHKSIYSRLNPLKICSPGIVTEFARIAHHFQLLYVYPLLETNKRIRITAFRSISSLSNPNFSQVEREIRAGDHLGYQLDAYFPFDPYHLPRSRRWLEGDYVEWRGVPGLDADDDSDSAADDDGDEDDEDATGTDEE